MGRESSDLPSRVRHHSENSKESIVKTEESGPNSLESIQSNWTQNSQNSDSGIGSPDRPCSADAVLVSLTEKNEQFSFNIPDLKNSRNKDELAAATLSASNANITPEDIFVGDILTNVSSHHDQGIASGSVTVADLPYNLDIPKSGGLTTSVSTPGSSLPISRPSNISVQPLALNCSPANNGSRVTDRVDPTISEFMYEFPLCEHGLRCEYICLNCVQNACLACICIKHSGHNYEKALTYPQLLKMESVIANEMAYYEECLKGLATHFVFYQINLLQGALTWLKQFKLPKIDKKLDQLEVESANFQKQLYYQQVLIGDKRKYNKKLMSGMKSWMLSGQCETVRDSIINVQCCWHDWKKLRVNTVKLIENCILAEGKGACTLSEIVRSAGVDIFTNFSVTEIAVYFNKLVRQEPLSSTAADMDQRVHSLRPHTEVLSVISQPLQSVSTPSPTVSDSFTFARMAPISPMPEKPNSYLSSAQEMLEIAELVQLVEMLDPDQPTPKKVELSTLLEADPAVLKQMTWQPLTPQPATSAAQQQWAPLTPQPQMQQSSRHSWLQKRSLRQSPSQLQRWDRPPFWELQQMNVVPRVPVEPLPQPAPFAIELHVDREYANIGLPVGVVGFEGNGLTNLCRPWGVCCDCDNNIIVGDRSNNRIQIYGSDYSYLTSFGSFGHGEGELNRPAGVAVNPEGHIVVADKDNHRIQVFDRKGRVLLVFGRNGSANGQFIYPWDVACNEKGEIAVTDTRNHRVQIFSRAGVFLKKYGWEKGNMLSKLDQPRGVVFTARNRLLVSDFNNHRIIQITFESDRTHWRQWNRTGDGFLERPQGLAQDARGNILVSDSRNHRIVVFNRDGQYVSQFGSQGKEFGQFDRPVDVAVANNGQIAVVDFGSDRVQIF